MTDEVGPDHCRVTEADASRSIEGELEYHRHVFAYAEAARRLPPGARVLEIGSGGGYGASYLAARGFDVTAVEPSTQAVAYSKERFPQVRFVVGSGTELPVDGPFAAAVSFQVIEHVADVARYLNEMRRVLVPGGQVFITTPNRHLRLFPLQRPWNPYHLREYSARSLREAISRVFPGAEIHGVYARRDLMRIEIARVRRIKLGRFGAPVAWIEQVRRLFVRVPPIGEADFFLSSRTSRCLDLFAMART